MTEETPVSVSLDVTDGRTTITVSGDRDTAVVVRSASGERIYLPPEDFDRAPREGTAYGTGDSPYQSADGPSNSATDSPYQSADSPYQSVSDSPYQSADARQSPGLEPTPDGFRIVHPEEVSDFRLLR